MAHFADHYYHVYNRGCNRERIFTNDDNYRYLLKNIKRILPASSVVIIAYCLMPNHYHFLLRSESDGAIGRFTQRLFNGYIQAFNRQQGRSGTLFEGRVKSIEFPHPGEYEAFIDASVDELIQAKLEKYYFD